jgi:hypothetical protein
VRGQVLFVAALLAGSAGAGCLGIEGRSQDDALGTPPAVVAEDDHDVFYVISDADGRRLSREPDPAAFDDYGFSSGGKPCERGLLPQPASDLTEPCYGDFFAAADPLVEAHDAGSTVDLHFWMNGFAGAAQLPFALEAWIYADGIEVAHGITEAHAPPPLPSIALVQPNCSEWFLQLPLTAAVDAGAELALSVRADGAQTVVCSGNGEDGSRLLFETAGAATASSSSPSETP